MKLVLGVNTGSYYDMKGISGDELGTVEEVAHAIEDRYGVMQKFVEMNPALIGDQVATMLAKRLEGEAITGEPMSPIIKAFQDALVNKKFDGTSRGVPTMASIKGRGWRKNSPKRQKGRPSFIDTETYKNSFTSVLTDA